MKKIGILTASRTNNFGTDIQAYAMQMLFSQYADVEIINYRCTNLERSHNILPNLDVKSIIRLPYKIYKNITHSLFRKRHFKYSPTKYHTKNLKEICDRYDAIVVGSDQIWNLNITGNDLNFFLPWHSTKAKKFSYAASIGANDISVFERKYAISEFLRDFERVSVRESSAVTVLKAININAYMNLDPIQMINNDVWESFAKRKRDRKSYMLIYQVETPIEMCNNAREYARNKSYNVLRISPPTFPCQGIKSCSFLSLERWMNLMLGAAIVITDSYHGLSFCISNHVNFRLIDLPSEEKNIRSYNLLERLHLEKFNIKSNEYSRVPDWIDVDDKLQNERIESLEYVKKICSENKAKL